ncbi:MAG: glutaredoxin [Pseudoalteromonas sp.]|uniref:glutaredoxin family protein n=1 Tax=Pseudoalteromonas sp. TaxID=53249 RepID=UPI001D44F4D5|nr:glutaredoxin [Pseudoalteromonas sp.]NRA77152.1 glutaredoxin [Pseudoalteromonas sp.]
MITIYGKPKCKYCTKAKELLNRLQTPFKYIDISLDPEAKKFIIATGATTVPQIYNEEVLIGGFDDLEVYVK